MIKFGLCFCQIYRKKNHIYLDLTLLFFHEEQKYKILSLLYYSWYKNFPSKSDSKTKTKKNQFKFLMYIIMILTLYLQ